MKIGENKEPRKFVQQQTIAEETERVMVTQEIQTSLVLGGDLGMGQLECQAKWCWLSHAVCVEHTQANVATQQMSISFQSLTVELRRSGSVCH